MPGILGKKLGMTRLLTDDGRVIPFTVIECQPNTVVQVKTDDKDGYPAVVLGFDALKRPTKNRKYRHLREFRLADGSLKVGDNVTVGIFEENEKIQVTSVSKGKGFQGVVKRHHFSKGPETHGSHHHREPGSIGARAKPGKVHKGKRMAGHMGSDTVTIQNLEIVYRDAEKNVVGVRGPVPGGNGTLVIIRKQS